MSLGIVCLLGSVCVLTSLLTVSLAQEKEAKPSLKAKGRLPAHYKDVVTAEQKDKIYAIQLKYNEQIRKLAEEMKALTEQRDGEIEALLSADQKAKIDALKANSKKKPAAAETTSATEVATEKVVEATKEKPATAAKPASK